MAMMKSTQQFKEDMVNFDLWLSGKVVNTWVRSRFSFLSGCGAGV